MLRLFAVNFAYIRIFDQMADKGQYVLECETIHCFGRHISRVGVVDNEEEAAKWKKDLEESGKKPSLPKNDPIRSCPVVRCPLKRQIPRYRYRLVDPD